MEPENDGAPKSAYFVQSLERGIAVIRSFDEEHAELTLSDVARRTGMSRATARRLLLTLVDLGFVRQSGRLFSLRPSILSLGYSYLSSLGLSDVVEPHIEELVETVQESSSVSVLDDDDIVYVARVSTKRIMNVTISVGTRFPAYATSMGRVLLAYRTKAQLEQYLATVDLRPLTGKTLVRRDELRTEIESVRAKGWALVDQELEEGLRSIAAPIFDGDGQTIAAINVSVSARSGSAEMVEQTILPPLLQTAARIEDDLRGGRRVFQPEVG